MGRLVLIRDVEDAGTAWAFRLAEEMGDSVSKHNLPITDDGLVHPTTGAGESFWGCRPQGTSVHVAQVSLAERPCVDALRPSQFL